VAGIKENDWIKKVGEIEIKKAAELTAEVDKNKGKEIELLINREGQDITLSVQVREKAPEGEGLMGIVISNTEMEKVKWYEFYKGIGAGFREAYFWGEIIFSGVAKMVGSLFAGDVPKDVSGPLGIFEATSSIRSNQGLLAVIHFFGIVSVNLAVVNVLPFPALDGGRIIFVLYELIFRKKANEKFEVAVNNLGMLILLTLLLLITVGDVGRLISR
jgi:regulator of sigma E protease